MSTTESAGVVDGKRVMVTSPAVATLAGIDFTQREVQVMIGVVRGKTNEEIGSHTGLATMTVKCYVARVFKKVGVGDRASLVSWGYENEVFQGLRPEPQKGSGVALTNREKEITLLVVQGLTNAEIGRRVFLSEDTIKTHLRKAFKKVGATNRSHLVALAYQRGWVPEKEKV